MRPGWIRRFMTSMFHRLPSRRRAEKKSAGMDRDGHVGASATSANPLAPLPAHITDRNHCRDYSSESSVLRLRCRSASASSPLYLFLRLSLSLPTTPMWHPTPSYEVGALKGAITPIRSASMRIISRQVQKIALFIMKVIYTCPPCRAGHAVSLSPSKRSRLFLFPFFRFLAVSPLHIDTHTHSHTHKPPMYA